MAINLYESQSQGPSSIVRFLATANLALTFGVLAGWQAIGPWLADPISEATGASLSDSRPEFAEYPYSLLWLGPLVAIVAANFAEQLEMPKLARLIAGLPITLVAACLVWYYLLGEMYR